MMPPPEALALAGMALVGLFTIWKMQIAPRIAARRAIAMA